MDWMTRKAFEAKWGTSGKYDGGTWYMSSIGNIIANGVVPSTAHSQYSAWDGFFTSLGCTPPDPRDAVFKAYGWKSGDHEWSTSATGSFVFVRKNGDCSHTCDPFRITTAAQAEALCVLMGLTKVGG